jgi:hypothetical protein
MHLTTTTMPICTCAQLGLCYVQSYTKKGFTAKTSCPPLMVSHVSGRMVVLGDVEADVILSVLVR